MRDTTLLRRRLEAREAEMRLEAEEAEPVQEQAAAAEQHASR